MEIELQEISDFVSTIHPFEHLPQAIIAQLTKKMTIRYIRRGTIVPVEPTTQGRLYLLRKGAVSLLSEQQGLLGKLGEGDICTAFCQLLETIKFSIHVEEDTLVYTIACQTLSVILQDYPEELSYLQKTSTQRLNQNMKEMEGKNTLDLSLMQTTLSDVMNHSVITADISISIHNAAIIMADKNVSSLIILQDGQAVGILTDKDITKRCVAGNVPVSNPVEHIMTADIVSVSKDSDAFEAMMIMTRKHIQHLPVIDDQQLKGIISVTDFLRHEGRNSVYITNAINKSQSIEEVQEHSQIIPQLQLQLVQMGAKAEHLAKIITAISSAITRRLIELAEIELGPAPVPYAWVAAGSHARREQSSHSDQDNALIISDQMAKQDDQWFAALAEFVCDGLNQCGYVYCPGDVMATNSKWRQPARRWTEYFTNWITTPSPKALMYSSIFFDLRCISGDTQLVDDVRKKMLSLSPKNNLFLAHLTFNALKLKPPLGFFRDFVLIHDGKHNDTLDLKHNGLAPIVDLARIYALAEGVEEVSTIERLKRVSGTKSLTRESADDLLDAFEFISNLRVKHQAQQISIDVDADNFMAPSEISKLERSHLKGTFKVIQNLQNYVEIRYKIS